jgi:DNA modification methylase
MLFPDEPSTPRVGPVECLGKTFDSEDERRAYFGQRLREKLQDPEFRRTEGFPLGTDDNILALSDPPWITACPNPFLAEFIKHYGQPNDRHPAPHRTPYAGDFHSSIRHPVHAFHPYHTKVPPEIIRTLIEHYTDPGDLVLDGFCGSGMTGVAAREAGRHAILADLCPVAAFISGVNCQSNDWPRALQALRQASAASAHDWDRLYRTVEYGRGLTVNYYVWSDVFTCPACGGEFPFFPHGVLHHGHKVETRKVFPCPFCKQELNVRRVRRVLTSQGKKKALVWLNAGAARNRVNRAPNEYDLSLAKEAEDLSPALWYPTDPVNPEGYSAKLAQLGDKVITDVSCFLSRRNRIIFADLWARVGQLPDAGVRHLCQATLTSIFTVVSERQGYFGGGGGMSGNLYMPIVRMEKNIYDTLRRKLRRLEEAERAKERLRSHALVSTQSTTSLAALPDDSIDYIYTDPPFGSNIIYSEMNAALEGWLRVRTNDRPEAVIDIAREREFDEYGALMRACFREYHRVLKPGRWITVEFHNTAAAVWNLIQNVLGECGLVVAQVGVVNKGSTTILADIRPGAARHDLIIAAYKPSVELEERFRLQRGSAEGAWEFVRNHLARLPLVARGEKGTGGVVAERTNHLLYDRMLAFHVQRNLAVPLSAVEFYAGLRARFPETDGMYFLPEQLEAYAARRATGAEPEQPSLFVADEPAAIDWLRQELATQPQTIEELQPKFARAMAAWPAGERRPDLHELLQENFTCHKNGGPGPALLEGHPGARWYVPDPCTAQNREVRREQALLEEFRGYLQSHERQLGSVRIEAVRAGFRKAWQERHFRTIIDVARKIPDDCIREDPQLLMWYDQAVARLKELG